MGRFTDRGYVVKENGPVYYTTDMEKTIRWFEDVLGWYGEVADRDPDGVGMYGCVYNIPPEIEALRVAPFTGIHLFHGKPKGDMIALLYIRGIEALRAFVKANGWNKITEVRGEEWGSKFLDVKTPDGYVLRFLE